MFILLKNIGAERIAIYYTKNFRMSNIHCFGDPETFLAVNFC